jgi:hypothetical protein
VGIGGAVSVDGGGGAADPWPNCHVHDAVARDPAGCMGPTLPVTAGVLEPVTLVLFGATSIAGNVHSNASAAIGPGFCGLPSIVSC